MKHLLTPILIIFLLLGSGCAPRKDISSTQEIPATQEEPAESYVYVQFIQNVHDWVFPEYSIESTGRILDLHEKYQIPVELYFTDQVFQAYLEQAPELIERIKTSPLVSVSFHVRPPHPYMDDFDNFGLSEMSQSEQYEILKTYEEHRLDVETGEYTDEPGGYQLIKDTIGYAPRVVGNTVGGEAEEAYNSVLKDKGALFAVFHGHDSDMEETFYGLHRRPEDQEIKLYEYGMNGFNLDNLFKEWTADYDESNDYFVNLKFHENNFYTAETPFGPIYWDQPDKKLDPYPPPYDLTRADQVEFKTQIIQNEKWDIYEQTLQYVSEHTDWLTAINAADLEEMLD